MKTKTAHHTPTPWKWNNGNLVGPDGDIIAEKNDDGSPDAAFIVKCVNNHDELIAALKQLVRSVPMDASNFNMGGAVKQGLRMAEQALTNAGKGE